jgi:hypothetical protein
MTNKIVANRRDKPPDPFTRALRCRRAARKAVHKTCRHPRARISYVWIPTLRRFDLNCGECGKHAFGKSGEPIDQLEWT